MAAGLLALVLSALLPLRWPALSGITDRVVPLLSLVFLLAAVGLWLRLGGRAFVVSIAIVGFLYIVSTSSGLAFRLGDLFLIALLVSFLIFALAGFNLVMVLEEVVWDLHRVMHLRRPVWLAVPVLTVAGLAVGIPLFARATGFAFPALWIASVAGLAVLGGFWFVRLFNRFRTRSILPELHVLVMGTLLATFVVDLLGRLQDSSGLVPSLVGYLALVLTWVYVSYTTLQRVHFVLPGDDPMPWVSLLLSASFAILYHAHLQFEIAGSIGIAGLVDRRLGYLVLGMFLGLSFHALQATWRILRVVRDMPALSGRGRTVAGRAARVAEELVHTEARVGAAVGRFYRRVEAWLPRRRGWEFDLDEGIRSLDSEE